MSTQEFPKKELETLWAPWRVEYFEKEPRDLNFLSAAAQTSEDAAHLVITRRKNAFLMMNRYPYAVGHLMAVPYRKTAELSVLGENEIVELWNLVAHAQALLRAAIKAQGLNVGLNLGESPRISPEAYVAPNAVVCGDVTVGSGCRILFGAQIIAEGGSITLGTESIVFENAVLRSNRKHNLRVGNNCLIGPNAHVVGC